MPIRETIHHAVVVPRPTSSNPECSHRSRRHTITPTHRHGRTPAIIASIFSGWWAGVKIADLLQSAFFRPDSPPDSCIPSPVSTSVSRRRDAYRIGVAVPHSSAVANRYLVPDSSCPPLLTGFIYPLERSSATTTTTTVLPLLLLLLRRQCDDAALSTCYQRPRHFLPADTARSKRPRKQPRPQKKRSSSFPHAGAPQSDTNHPPASRVPSAPSSAALGPGCLGRRSLEKQEG